MLKISLALMLFLSGSAFSSVILDALDPNLELGTDCSATATRVMSLSISGPEQANISDDIDKNQILIVHSAQKLTAQDLATTAASSVAFNPKHLNQIYYWKNDSFDWLQAYSSNQTQLDSKPFLALSRLHQTTLALAIVTLNDNTQLQNLLSDDFIANRYPLVLSLSSPMALSQQQQQWLSQQGFKGARLDQHNLLSKGLTVCDSGADTVNNENKRWLSFDMH